MIWRCMGLNDLERHKEIDLVQSVITRMSDRQCTLNGLFFTLLSSIIVFEKGISIQSCALGLFGVHTFGNMVKNFLETERLYRAWYDFIIGESREDKYLYELSVVRIKVILKQNGKYNDGEIKKKSWSTTFYRWLYFILPAMCCQTYFGKTIWNVCKTIFQRL
jgi:hypothetical protein